MLAAMDADSRAPSTARAALHLAAWALAVSLVVSRLGLVLHELGGHGLAAVLAGGEVADLHFYTFGGGWISYAGTRGWGRGAVVAVSMAGIAIELVVAAGLAIVVARRGRRDLAATGILAAALGLALHAGFYLAAGTADGFGDGAPLHRALGGARWVVVAPVALALAVLAFAGGRRIGSELRGVLPAASRGRHAVILAAALAGAGAVHAGLVAGELALRPSPTYQRVMATARDRAIADDVARWQADAARAGREPTPAEREAARRAAAARHRGIRVGPPLAIALAAAAAAGLLTAPRRAPRVLGTRAVAGTAALALASVILVVAIDVAAAAWW